jgi:hypothetical protein
MGLDIPLCKTFFMGGGVVLRPLHFGWIFNVTNSIWVGWTAFFTSIEMVMVGQDELRTELSCYLCITKFLLTPLFNEKKILTSTMF